MHGRIGVLEVEVKFPVADFAPLEAKLRQWGATFDPARRDEDRYFNAPDRDFAVTDEALRVRSIGSKNVVTYKGPKVDAETKSRLEIETPLADGPESAQEMARVFTHLRYRATGVVRKSRRIARFQRDGFEMQASLDEVDGVGRYAEVETMAEEERFADAKAAVLAAATELGMTQPERRSYLQLMLERQQPEKS
jgi:adenylate cyclase class 2